MQQRRQAHVPQLSETDPSEMTFLVTAEDQTQDLFRQPAIENPQLVLIIHVLKIIIKDGHISKTLIDGLRGNRDQELGAGGRVGDLLPSAASAAIRHSTAGSRTCPAYT